MRKKLRKVPRKHEKIKAKKKNLWNWIKENPILILTIVSVIISAVILFFMLSTHESDPEVNCEIAFVQRPDSMFQANLYIWNSGDQVAENIVIWAKRDEVFQWDSSGNRKKGRLYVFPHFSVYAIITPNQILDNLARKRPFNNHQLTFPQLSTSNREDNYLVICPHIEKLEQLKALPNSIYRFKYIELGKTAKIKSYQEDILENIQVIHQGKSLKIEVAEILNQAEIDSNKIYFPTYEEFRDYRTKATLPNNIMPPIELEKQMIKKKKDKEEDDSWFLLF